MLNLSIFLFFFFQIPVIWSNIVSQEEVVNYNKFKIFEISGKNRFANEDELFNYFEIPLDESSQLLHEDSEKNTVQLLLSPEIIDSVVTKLKNQNINYEIINEDLGETIHSIDKFRTASDNLNGTASFDRFMSADEIGEYLSGIALKNPDTVQITDIGKSVEGQPIKMAIISNIKFRRSKGAAKNVVFIESGIHAREWIAPASALYLIEKLLATPSLTRDIEWRIVPLANPDGYKYTWTTNRMWRKNRQPPPVGRDVTGRTCYGVDLNRNFDAYWMKEGSSTRQCSEVYAGTKAFSEPESLAIKNAVEEVKERIKAYVSIHSYGQYILFPPGIKTNEVPAKRVQLHELMSLRMAKEILNATSTIYTYGAPAKILYPASGLSMDWALLKANVPVSFTFEMRDKGAFGFILHPDKIRDTANDFYTAMKIIAEEIPLLRSNLDDILPDETLEMSADESATKGAALEA